MTEEEFKDEMKRLGWSEMEIWEMITAHEENIREYAVAVPFEVLLEEKPQIESN